MPEKNKGNNPDRFEKKCVICQTRNAQQFDHFCNQCVIENRAEALAYLGMEEAHYDPREDTTRYQPRGWKW